MSAVRQLALPFVHLPPLTDLEFLPSDATRPALAWLASKAAWPSGRLALWGGPGSGKTHLLHIWAARAGATLISGPTLRAAWPTGAPTAAWPTGALAIDDADLIPSEPTLLHALNAAHEAHYPVLLSGRTPPARWPVALPDLASRLRAITAVKLGAMDDEFLRLLFARLLSDRQLIVSAQVQDWMLAVLPRDPATLREAAARLDRAALAAGRGVTRTLAAQALDDLLCDISGLDAPETSPPHPALF